MDMSVEGVSGPYGMAVPTSDEKTMSLIAHAGGILFGFVPSLIVYLTKGTESAFVKEESREALNFQITVAIAYAVSSVLVIVLIGLLMLPVVWVMATIFSIMGAIAVNNGGHYRYPINLRLVK
jgi:uncharacterized Tic20 family protein